MRSFHLDLETIFQLDLGMTDVIRSFHIHASGFSPLTVMWNAQTRCYRCSTVYYLNDVCKCFSHFQHLICAEILMRAVSVNFDILFNFEFSSWSLVRFVMWVWSLGKVWNVCVYIYICTLLWSPLSVCYVHMYWFSCIVCISSSGNV